MPAAPPSRSPAGRGAQALLFRRGIESGMRANTAKYGLSSLATRCAAIGAGTRYMITRGGSTPASPLAHQAMVWSM
jgi:hypothetical protein